MNKVPWTWVAANLTNLSFIPDTYASASQMVPPIPLEISHLRVFVYFFFFWLLWVFVAAHWLFSGCGERRLLLVAARGILIVVASLAAEHGL